MDYFFYNTDKTDVTLIGAKSRFRILIEKKFAATSGPKEFGEQLRKLSKGDILLMYENEIGVVAIGTIVNRWDGKSHTPPLYYLGRFAHEYRINVDWFLDLSDNPITLGELRQRIGSPRFTPRGAVSNRIVKWRAEIEKMIVERRGSAPATHEAKNSTPPEININRFFTETLGANLRNPRWSWGAIDPITNRIFLRVWNDQVEKLADGERVLVALDEPRRDSNGFAERHAHIAQIRNGAEGLGIVCTAADPETKEARKIASFDQTTLLRLGAITNENGRNFARIDARVPVEEIARQQTAQSTLTEDLKSIEGQKIESTTKDALISARVGQGKFRTQVLHLWGNCCAVTGSRTHDAVRASHIKPWRKSTNEERLDPNNGLPLVASLDALFDAGLISFDTSGEMIVSSILNTAERKIFDIGEESLAKKPAAKTADYLAYHRNEVFRK